MRWITSLLTFPVLALIVAYGGADLFALLVFLVMTLALNEYLVMVLGRGNLFYRLIAHGAASLIFTSFYLGDHQIIGSSVFMTLIVLFLVFLRGAQHGSFDFNTLAKVIVGIIYCSFTLSHLLFIRQLPDGIVWVFLVLIMAFAGDTLGFYFGKTWGKRKLFPAISPGKTVEGLLGVIMGGVLTSIFFKVFFIPEMPAFHAVLMGFLGSIIGQLGDLSESAIKRTAGIKDSGVILPGHGGILDRIDGLLFSIPFLYYYRIIVLT